MRHAHHERASRYFASLRVRASLRDNSEYNLMKRLIARVEVIYFISRLHLGKLVKRKCLIGLFDQIFVKPPTVSLLNLASKFKLGSFNSIKLRLAGRTLLFRMG